MLDITINPVVQAEIVLLDDETLLDRAVAAAQFANSSEAGSSAEAIARALYALLQDEICTRAQGRL